MNFQHLLLSLALATITLAVPNPAGPSLSKRCTNSASDRACWGDYDISTNYYDESPDTGVVREYWFDIVNTTAAPDGIERVVLSVNGTVPGPTIIADWGDTVGKFSGVSDFLFLLCTSIPNSKQITNSSQWFMSQTPWRTTEPASTSTVSAKTTPTRWMACLP